MTAARQLTSSDRNRRPTSRARRNTTSRSRATNAPAARVVRPQLRVLDQQALRRRVRRRNAALALFIVVIIGFFAAALAQAQLVANQHELDLLRARIAEAEAERARLERDVEESSAPAAVIERAGQLGMVRANDPVYLAAVSPAPPVVPVSMLTAVTAETAGETGADGGLAASIEQAGTAMASLAGSSPAVSPAGSQAAESSPAMSPPAVASELDQASGGVGTAVANPAGQIIAGIAGVHAVATGIRSG